MVLSLISFGAVCAGLGWWWADYRLLPTRVETLEALNNQQIQLINLATTERADLRRRLETQRCISIRIADAVNAQIPQINTLGCPE